MKKRKMTPEQREERRRMREESLKARAQLQSALDHAAEYLRLWDEARERKRRSLRYRLNPFRRAA